MIDLKRSTENNQLIVKKINLIACILFLSFTSSPENLEREAKEGNTNSESKLNVLFIIVDDLRDELGCYGNTAIHSPNIDRIASEGIIFSRAYCQYPLCGPSRCSLLTGLRPSRTRFRSNQSMVDKEVPGIESLPEHFKHNGYYTISNGKVFHDHGNIMDGMDGWSELPWEPHPGFWVWKSPENKKFTFQGYKARKGYIFGPSYEAADVPDDAYPTGKVTTKTICDLRRLKDMEQPFFLAVGFRKPHLPLNAPKKYWDLYSKEQFSLADNFQDFTNIPEVAIHNSPELRSYNDIPDEGEISEETWINLIHGYYACVSYTDRQIGILISELERLKLRENTIVVIIGDHGYQLSDHGMWSKATNFHEVVRSPLIISIPGNSGGQSCNQLVEFIDIYPTLTEVCGLNLPAHLEGISFLPAVTNEKGSFSPKQAAFSRVADGETIITDNFIYTEWINENGESYQRMLFDLNKDPLEQENLAGLKKYESTVSELSKKLHQKNSFD